MPNSTNINLERVYGHYINNVVSSITTNTTTAIEMPTESYESLEPSPVDFDECLEEESVSDSSNNEQACLFCDSIKNIKRVRFRRHTINMCEDCNKKYIDICRKCGNAYEKDRLFDIFNNGNCYCVNCLFDSGYKICHNCKKWSNNIVSIHNNYDYCSNCLSDLNIETFRCNSCGKHYLQDRYGKNNHCITCVNAELREVRNYSYKPEPRFFKVSSEYDNLYLGVELEMGYVNEPNIVNDFVAEYSNNFFYMKKDTSIPIYGCEIVTQPATLKKHLNSKYWKPLLEASKEYGFNASNNKCGIHVHVSREFFNSDDISSLDCFVNSYDFWKKIARRESHYSEYLNKDEDSWGRQITNRRCALNLSNTETVEFRIFQGTLEYDEIMAYLEACHAASVFVKACTNNILNIADEENKKRVVNEFINFVHKSKYSYLERYFVKFKIFG